MNRHLLKTSVLVQLLVGQAHNMMLGLPVEYTCL
jgi:hypothetical protein